MKLGSFCSGAGGLDMAVGAAFGAPPAWHCEKDLAASKVLAYRYQGVPNYGDLITTDWSTVEPIDILCAGWPCQPFSLAGKQKGADDERAIWPEIARAIRILRPRIIVLENVSAVLRVEFGRVADSLAALGYDLRWTCLRASDVGAPHRRERLFIVATDTTRDGRHEGWSEPARIVGGPDAAVRSDADVALLPTPQARDGAGAKTPEQIANRRTNSGGPPRNLNDTVVNLLPTPTARDRKGTGPSEINRKSPSMAAIGALLPTPAAADGRRGQDYARAERDGSGGDDLVTAAVKATNANQWGKYTPAIEQWEAITRDAPSPTEPNTKGNPRLNPAFSEWMMGWPAGWVTEVPGVSRNDQLRIIGNGVCPQQAHAALTYLLSLGCGVAS